MRTLEGARGGGIVGSDDAAAAAAAAAAEAEVIARVRAGEAEAYAVLVRAHTAIALRVAVALGAGPDAEDVVQCAFIKAYQALGGFRAGERFRPWLLRIVANEARNAVRAARRQRSALGREAGTLETEPLIPDSVDPELAALRKEWWSALSAALGALSDEQRLVVTYRYLMEMDEPETARALGCPRGTVKSRLSRALKQLHRLLGEGGAEALRDAVGGQAPEGGEEHGHGPGRTRG